MSSILRLLSNGSGLPRPQRAGVPLRVGASGWSRAAQEAESGAKAGVQHLGTATSAWCRQHAATTFRAACCSPYPHSSTPCKLSLRGPTHAFPANAPAPAVFPARSLQLLALLTLGQIAQPPASRENNRCRTQLTWKHKTRPRETRTLDFKFSHVTPRVMSLIRIRTVSPGKWSSSILDLIWKLTEFLEDLTFGVLLSCSWLKGPLSSPFAPHCTLQPLEARPGVGHWGTAAAAPTCSERKAVLLKKNCRGGWREPEARRAWRRREGLRETLRTRRASRWGALRRARRLGRSRFVPQPSTAGPGAVGSRGSGKQRTLTKAPRLQS